jgi:hypothetical protein
VLGIGAFPTLFPTFSLNIAVKGSKSREKVLLYNDVKHRFVGTVRTVG